MAGGRTGPRPAVALVTVLATATGVVGLGRRTRLAPDTGDTVAGTAGTTGVPPSLVVVPGRRPAHTPKVPRTATGEAGPAHVEEVTRVPVAAKQETAETPRLATVGLAGEVPAFPEGVAVTRLAGHPSLADETVRDAGLPSLPEVAPVVIVVAETAGTGGATPRPRPPKESPSGTGDVGPKATSGAAGLATHAAVGVAHGAAPATDAAASGRPTRETLEITFRRAYGVCHATGPTRGPKGVDAAVGRATGRPFTERAATKTLEGRRPVA